jgi:hypothetical protein
MITLASSRETVAQGLPDPDHHSRPPCLRQASSRCLQDSIPIRLPRHSNCSSPKFSPLGERGVC